MTPGFAYRRFTKPSSIARYTASVLLAATAQLARLPLHAPTMISHVTCVPFIVLSGWFGGFGPGLLTTGLSILVSAYFYSEPAGAFGVHEIGNWPDLGALAFTGLVTSVLFERLARTQTSLRTANRELATIHASAPVVLLVVDDELHVEKANDLAAQFAGEEISKLVGAGIDEALGCLNALGNPRGCGSGPSCAECPMRLAVMDTLRQGTRHYGIEVSLPAFLDADGEQKRRCLLVSTAPLEFRCARQALVCAQDITQLRQVEDSLHEIVHRLESALAEKTTLLKEVHHRVKNNLAVISSLLSLKAEGEHIAEAKLALVESQQRVRSIALIHEHLYGSDHFDRINFPECRAVGAGTARSVRRRT